LQVKLCDSCLSALCVPWCKRRYINTLPFLSFPYCTDPDVTLGNGRGCPLVVHYWVDLQSVQEFRCYEREMSASACTRSMRGFCCNDALLCIRWRSESVHEKERLPVVETYMFIELTKSLLPSNQQLKAYIHRTFSRLSTPRSVIQAVDDLLFYCENKQFAVA